VATNTIESLSLAKDALQQVIAFNRLAGTGGGQRADGKPVDDLAPRFMLGLCDFGADASDALLVTGSVISALAPATAPSGRSGLPRILTAHTVPSATATRSVTNWTFSAAFSHSGGPFSLSSSILFRRQIRDPGCPTLIIVEPPGEYSGY
jgi:hypothetical protein